MDRVELCETVVGAGATAFRGWRNRRADVTLRWAVRVSALAVLYVVTSGTLTGCRALVSQGSGPVWVTHVGPSAALGWDNPNVAALPETPSAVSYFEVYYRRYGRREWRELGTTENAETTISFTNTDLPYGQYEFAVSAVTNDGKRSELHLSSDFDAWPTGGWYFNWIAP